MPPVHVIPSEGASPREESLNLSPWLEFETGLEESCLRQQAPCIAGGSGRLMNMAERPGGAAAISSIILSFREGLQSGEESFGAQDLQTRTKDGDFERSFVGLKPSSG